MDFTFFLEEQAAPHSAMRPPDAVKLCYQTAFGAEHLLRDTGPAREYCNKEIFSVREKAESLYKQISPGFCRVNLAAWKESGMPSAWLFEMFRVTASAGAEQARAEVFSEYYRENERPAYRVVSTRFIRLFPLLKRMSESRKDSGANIIAIDGRAASGKTTMANILAEITGAGVIHMDDFFLPGDLRAPERLAMPGGNVHHERFRLEVVPKIADGNEFSYQAFDCGEMRMGVIKQVASSRWRIVEGTYSCHPEIGGYMDIRVFCDVDADEQIKRITARNGRETASVFKSKWIPMEEQYFNSYQIKENADIVFE